MTKIFSLTGIIALVFLASCGNTPTDTGDQGDTASGTTIETGAEIPGDTIDENTNVGAAVTTTVSTGADGNVTTITTNGPAITPMTDEERAAFDKLFAK